MGCKIFKNNTLIFFKIQNNKNGQKNHPNQVKKPKCQYTKSQHHKDPNTTFVNHPPALSLINPSSTVGLWHKDA